MDEATAQRKVFEAACDLLLDFQDDLDWCYVTSKFKTIGNKWARKVKQIRKQHPIDGGQLWQLLLEWRDVIKPGNMLESWEQVKPEWERTSYMYPRAILRAIMILRAHTMNMIGGPLFQADGTPLPGLDPHSWVDPAPGMAQIPEGAGVMGSSSVSDFKMCGINGCPLELGHNGLCAIETIGAQRRICPPAAAPLHETSHPPPFSRGSSSTSAASTSGGVSQPRGGDAAADDVPPGVPPGWTDEIKETTMGRKYHVYHSPGGTHKCDSRKKAWLQHQQNLAEEGSSSPPPQNKKAPLVTGAPKQSAAPALPAPARAPAASAPLVPPPTSAAAAPSAPAASAAVPAPAPAPVSAEGLRARKVVLVHSADAKAKEAHKSKDPEAFREAEELYSELLAMPLEIFRKNPTEGEETVKKNRAWHLVNRCFVRVQMGPEQAVGAIEDANEAIELGDRRPQAYWRKVMALDMLERPKEANATAQQGAVNAEPPTPPTEGKPNKIAVTCWSKLQARAAKVTADEASSSASGPNTPAADASAPAAASPVVPVPSEDQAAGAPAAAGPVEQAASASSSTASAWQPDPPSPMSASVPTSPLTRAPKPDAAAEPDSTASAPAVETTPEASREQGTLSGKAPAPALAAASEVASSSAAADDASSSDDDDVPLNQRAAEERSRPSSSLPASETPPPTAPSTAPVPKPVALPPAVSVARPPAVSVAPPPVVSPPAPSPPKPSPAAPDEQLDLALALSVSHPQPAAAPARPGSYDPMDFLPQAPPVPAETDECGKGGLTREQAAHLWAQVERLKKRNVPGKHEYEGHVAEYKKRSTGGGGDWYVFPAGCTTRPVDSRPKFAKYYGFSPWEEAATAAQVAAAPEPSPVAGSESDKAEAGPSRDAAVDVVMDKEMELKNARKMLVGIEDSVDMDHVNQWMQKNLMAWRNQTKTAKSLTDVAKQMRNLRHCMADDYKGRALFKPEFRKDSEEYKDWRQGASKNDITFDRLLALMRQLQDGYTGWTNPPRELKVEIFADKKPKPAKPKAAAAVPSFIRDAPVAPVARRAVPGNGTGEKAGKKREHSRLEEGTGEELVPTQAEATDTKKRTTISLDYDDEDTDTGGDAPGDDPADSSPAPVFRSLASTEEAERPRAEAGVKRLMELGVASEDQCRAALKLKGGDEAKAAEYLLASNESSNETIVGKEEPSAAGARKRLVKGAPPGGVAPRPPASSQPATSSRSAAVVNPVVQEDKDWKDAKSWSLEEVKRYKGAKLEMWWSGDRTYFRGKIVDINETSLAVFVKYEDGDWKWHKLWQEAFRNVEFKLPKPSAPPPKPAVKKLKKGVPDGAPARPASTAAPSHSKAAAVPTRKPVVKAPNAGSRGPAASGDAPMRAAKPTAASSTQQQQRAKAPATKPVPPPVERSASARPESYVDSKPVVTGRETRPPRYLPSGYACTCKKQPNKECEDTVCSNYRYYDAMRHRATHGKSANVKGLVTFSDGTGMLLQDPESEYPMVAELGGVRKHKTIPDKVEVLARWFVRANDNQIKAPDAERDPDQLVHRLSKGDEKADMWCCDWSKAASVLGKCSTSYAPPAVIRQHCERATKRGLTSEFFFDSYLPFDQDSGPTHECQPVKLPQSKLVQDAVTGDQPTAEQMAAAESSDEEDVVPLSRRRKVARSPGRAQQRAPRVDESGEVVAGIFVQNLEGGESGAQKGYRIKRNRAEGKRVEVDDETTTLPGRSLQGVKTARRALPPSGWWESPAQIYLDEPEMTAETEVRTDTCAFEHIVQPQVGDAFAGAYYELGLVGRRPRPQTAEVSTAELAELTRLAESSAPTPTAKPLTEQQREAARALATAELREAVPWGVKTVPRGLREPLEAARPRAHFPNGDAFRPYMGRFFPILLTRDKAGPDGRARYLEGKEPPLVCAAVDRALREASGKGRPAHIVLRRGVALEPVLGQRIPSWGCPAKGRFDEFGEQLRELEGQLRMEHRNGAHTESLDGKRRKLYSDVRFALNGMTLNRHKYTTFSRHFTSPRVLKVIADVLQSHLRPGDTFVDFACGLNTFAPLLKDPGSLQPLKSVAFDIFSPIDRTESFTRSAWLQVDAERDLPPGELVIGLNPPFGHMNRIAIEFVEHALCARPRLIALIMPSTNYEPQGYELLVRDEQLCRGSVFYTPGHGSSNIDAKNVKPNFLLYRRRDEVPLPRRCMCNHVRHELSVQSIKQRGRNVAEAKLKKLADARARALLGLASADEWPTIATSGPASMPASSQPSAAAPASLAPSLLRTSVPASLSVGAGPKDPRKRPR